MQISSMMVVELMMRRRSYRRRIGSHDIIGYLFLRFKRFKDPKSDIPVPTLWKLKIIRNSSRFLRNACVTLEFELLRDVSRGIALTTTTTTKNIKIIQKERKNNGSKEQPTTVSLHWINVVESITVRDIVWLGDLRLWRVSSIGHLSKPGWRSHASLLVNGAQKGRQALHDISHRGGWITSGITIS